MTYTEKLKAERFKLFGITYKPKQEKLIGATPDIMRKYILKKNTFDTDPDLAINKITTWLAEEKQVDIEDIYSNKRYRNLSDARHILFFLLYFTLPITQTYIGQKFNKHPSSVMHSIIKVKDLFINSLDFQAFIKQFDSFYFDRVAK